MNEAQTPYALLGEAGIRELCSCFYDIMDRDPAFADLRAMHAADLSAIKGKLAEYLIGWMGGPPLYAQKYGSVCMTEPHADYWIGPDERDQWLACMQQALDQIEASATVQEMLRIPLFRIADAVRNRPGPPAARGADNIIASN